MAGARTAHVPLRLTLPARAARRAVSQFIVSLDRCTACRTACCEAAGDQGCGSAARPTACDRRVARRQSAPVAQGARAVRCSTGVGVSTAGLAGHRVLAPATGAVAGAGVEVHPLAPGAGPDVSAARQAGGPHHRLACRGHPPVDRPAGRPAMTSPLKTFPQRTEIFITSIEQAGRPSRKVLALRRCIGPVETARQLTAAQRLFTPLGGAPGLPADPLGGRNQAGGAGGCTLHRGGKAHRRIPAMRVGRVTRQAVIGFPGEVHHG